MTGSIDVDLIGGILFEMLLDRDQAVEIETLEGLVTIASEAAAERNGMLPIFLIAADAIWTSKTGRSLGVHIVSDADALFHYRVQAIHHGPISAVLLALTEVIEQRSPGSSIQAGTLIEAWSTARAAPHRA